MQLVKLVISLVVCWCWRRYGEHSRQRLDLAVLGFFQNFRKVYIGAPFRDGVSHLHLPNLLELYPRFC